MTDLLNDHTTSMFPAPLRPLTAPTPGPFAAPAERAIALPSPLLRPAPAPTPPPPFPPPTLTTPPGPPAIPAPAPAARSRRRTLAALAALSVASAVTMGVLWSSAKSRADDADQARQTAEAGREIATQRQLEADVEVVTLRDELAAARQELAAVSPSIDTSALDVKIAELESEISRLTTENANLTASIDAIETAEQVEPELRFDPAQTPEFSRYVGELLSSRNAGSSLGQAQSECFGAAVINAIGIDALGAGLNNSSTAAANNAVVGAMQSAAVTCNIDPALIFG